MKRPHGARPRPASGFTLIETIMIVVVLAIAATVISAVHSRIFAGESSVKDLQVRSALMLECAEQVLAVRRHTPDGYTQVSAARFGPTLCDGVPALPGYAIPSVTLTESYVSAACPAGSTCKLVSISHGGMTPLTLMLVQ